MRCSSCGLINFRFNKKCPSCNATIRQTKGSPSQQPALCIFGSSGMGLAEGSDAGLDEIESLGTDFQDEAIAEDFEVAPDVAVEEEADFDLDLSEAKSGSGVAETAEVEIAPEISDSPPVEEAVDMQFDVEPAAAADLDDVQAEDMGFDFDAESVDLEEPALESAEEEGIELNLDEPHEIEANFDFDAEEPASDEPDAEPALDLDTELSFETDADSLEMDLSMDDDSEASLDMDMDLDPPKE